MMCKLMIVDDEEVTREGLSDLIRQSCPDISIAALASDGKEAYEMFLRICPQIIVCDIKMPHISGMELVSNIRLIDDAVQIIFVSAYSDKQYLKNAINFHAVDYIEKPVDTKELINAIEKAKKALHTTYDIKSGNARLNTAIESFKKNIVLELVFGKPDFEKINKEMELIGVLLTDDNTYLCGIVRLHKENENFQDMLTQLLNENYYFSHHFLLGVADNNFIIVFIINNNKRTAYHEAIRGLFVNLLGADGGKSISIGIGEEVSHVADLKSSYQTAYLAIKKLFLKGYGCIFKYNELNSTAYSYSPDTLTEFKNALENRNNYLAEKIVEDVTTTISECEGSDFIYVKEIYRRLYYATADIIAQRHLMPDEEIEYMAGVVLDMPTIQHISDAIIEKIHSIQEADEKSDYKSRLVYSIKKYIADHICSSLTLREIADYHYISVPYLCTVFKRETHLTVNKFIVQAKINKSKELFKDRSLKLKDISDILGYQNANYFARVFKSVEGINPSVYIERYYK